MGGAGGMPAGQNQASSREPQPRAAPAPEHAQEHMSDDLAEQAARVAALTPQGLAGQAGHQVHSTEEAVPDLASSVQVQCDVRGAVSDGGSGGGEGARAAGQLAAARREQKASKCRAVLYPLLDMLYRGADTKVQCSARPGDPGEGDTDGLDAAGRLRVWRVLEKLTESPSHCVALLQWSSSSPPLSDADADADADMTARSCDGVALLLSQLRAGPGQRQHMRESLKECLKVLQNVAIKVSPSAVQKMVRAGCVPAVAALAQELQHAGDAHLESEVAQTLARLGRHLAPPAPFSMLAAHARATSLSTAEHKHGMALCIDGVVAHVSALLETAEQEAGPDGSRSAAVAAAALLIEALKNLALLIHRSDPWAAQSAASKESKDRVGIAVDTATQPEMEEDVEADVQRIHRMLGLALRIMSWSAGRYPAAEDRTCRILMGLLSPCAQCEGTHWHQVAAKFLEANGACAQIASLVQRRGYGGYGAQDAWGGYVQPRKKRRSACGRRGSGLSNVTEQRWLWLYLQLGGTLPPHGLQGDRSHSPKATPAAGDARAAIGANHSPGAKVSPVSSTAYSSNTGYADVPEADVVFLVDGDNAANIFKHVDKFVRQKAGCVAHAFVSRHYDGACPPSLTLHHAITGLPDAADHEISFYAGMYVHASPCSCSIACLPGMRAVRRTHRVPVSRSCIQHPRTRHRLAGHAAHVRLIAMDGARQAEAWLRAGTRVVVVSKDDALENTVQLLRRNQITAFFFTPTCISSSRDISRRLGLGQTEERDLALLRPLASLPVESPREGPTAVGLPAAVPVAPVPVAPALAQPWLPASI